MALRIKYKLLQFVFFSLESSALCLIWENFLRLREVANGMLSCQRQKCITEILACVL